LKRFREVLETWLSYLNGPWNSKRGRGIVAGGADRQAIIAKGYSKTMVSRVVNAIKTELKQSLKLVETNPETS
jgi:hypothetical protein